jgi:hypothetical protein
MFYVFNVHEWLTEVIAACNENRLSPDESLFALVLFSSLDEDHVKFFRDRKKQVSSYSGDNVHIFTPIIYEDVIPDNEWRSLRDDFNRAGIEVDSQPSVIFFRLVHSPDSRKFEPTFFSAYRLPDRIPLHRVIQQIVDACIRFRASESRMIAELARITQSPNLVVRRERPYFAQDVGRVLDAPRLFLSHSSADKPFVRRVSAALTTERLHPWLDEHELRAGDKLRDTIEEALRRSDVLLIFLSSHSAKSHWLQHEAAFFAGAAKDGRIIPIVIDDAGHDLVSRLPAVQGLLYLDFRDATRWDENILKIIDAARKHHDG